MKQYSKVLGDKNFFLLWLGQGVSDIGSRIHSIALIWLVTELTGGATGVGLLFMFMTIPRIIVFPVAGVLVERWPKKWVVVLSDLARGIVAISMVFTRNMAIIYSLTALMITFELFFAPAIKTIIPRIVPADELLTANALSAVTSRSANLIGPAIGGVIVGLWGVQTAFLLNGVSFLFSSLSEMYITVPASAHEAKSKDERNIRRELLEGLNYIRNHKLVRFVVFFFAFAGIPFGAVMVLKVVLLTDVFGFSPEMYGLLMTIEGLGLLMGSFLMGAIGRRYPEISMMVAGVGALGLLYLALSQSPFFVLAAIWLFLIGIFGTMANIAYGTFLQKAVSDEYRSRVFSFDIAIGDMFAFASMGMAGLLGDTFGVTSVLAVCGAFISLMCLYASRLPVHEHIIVVD